MSPYKLITRNPTPFAATSRPATEPRGPGPARPQGGRPPGMLSEAVFNEVFGTFWQLAWSPPWPAGSPCRCQPPRAPPPGDETPGLKLLDFQGGAGGLGAETPGLKLLDFRGGAGVPAPPQ